MKKVIAVFILALLMRGLLAFVWHQTGHGLQISSDGEGYYELARSVKEGKGLQMEGKPSARRPPIYPLFIAFLLKWSPFPLGVQIAQAVIGAASCLILMGIATKIYDAKIGLLAGVMMSLDYTSVRQIVAILSETLFIFFLLATLYFLILGQKEMKTKFFFAAGALGGLTLLTKEVILLFFPLIVIWIFCLRRKSKKGVQQTLMFVMGLTLVVFPWVFRNTQLFERPVLVNVSAGHQFYLANNPQATGGTTGGDWEFGKDSFYPADDPNLPPLFTVEADHYLFRKGVDFVKSHPGRFFTLIGKRIWNMWRPYQSDSPLLARWLSAVTYIPIMVLGVLGMVLSLPRWREIFPVLALIAYVFLLHAVMIAFMRYRYPVMPLFMMFAAFAMIRMKTLSWKPQLL